MENAHKENEIKNARRQPRAEFYVPPDFGALIPCNFYVPSAIPIQKTSFSFIAFAISPPPRTFPFFPLHFPLHLPPPPPPPIFPIQREQRVSPATRNMQHATVEGFSVVVFCCVLFSFIFLCVFFTPEVLGHEFNPIGVSGSRKSPICGKFSTNLACTYLRNFLGNCKIVSYQQYFLQYFRHVSFHRIFF